MNRIKYLLSIFVGIFVYVLMSVTIGQNSIKCYKELEVQKKQISLQASAIESLNEELRMELAALKNDNDVIAAYARKLDYVSDGEKLVKITGLKPIQTEIYNTGSVVRHKELKFLEEKYCKITGLSFFVLTLILLFFYDLNNGNITFKKDEKPLVTGIPIYDLPQI